MKHLTWYDGFEDCPKCKSRKTKFYIDIIKIKETIEEVTYKEIQVNRCFTCNYRWEKNDKTTNQSDDMEK